MDWNTVLWKVIIAVAPIIVSVTVKLIGDLIAQMSEKNRATLKYWAGIFVKAAQMIEPDPAKRKAWVLGKLTELFPGVPEETLSALIEAVLAELKLESGEEWSELPPA